MNSEIKSKYERICPRAKWSDDEVRANFFKDNFVCESSEPNIIVVDNDAELKKILDEAGAIPLEEFLSDLKGKI